MLLVGACQNIHVREKAVAVAFTVSVIASSPILKEKNPHVLSIYAVNPEL